jgi:hypothetical protein
MAHRHDPGPFRRPTDASPTPSGGIFAEEDGQVTLTDGAGNKYWFVDTTAGNVVINLPDAPHAAPYIFTVKRKTAGANTITVTPESGTIDGSATHAVNTQYNCFRYASDGENYFIIAHYA